MIQYRLFNQFVLRTPILPLIDEENEINIEGELKCYIEDPKFQEALLLASPNLYNKLFDYLNNELKREKDKKTLPYSLLQYISRMTSRCTPFGLFAGVSIGSFNGKTNLVRSSYDSFKKMTRLDMNYLCTLASDLVKIESVKKQIKFYPNTSLYQIAGQLRYVEYTAQKNGRNHRISAVENSEYLQEILNMASNGAYLESLSEALVDDEITKEEADAFIDDLVDNQILVSELDPNVTGIYFFNVLKNKIQQLDVLTGFAETFGQVNEKLNEINNEPIGSSLNQYNSLTEILKNFDTKFEKKFLFQTDLFIPLKSTGLSSSIKSSLYQGIQLLNKISSKTAQNPVFNEFKKAFAERFEEEEVSLSFVFDSELGIGYRQNNSSVAGDVTPLVDDLQLPARSQGAQYEVTPFGNFLLDKYTEALKNDLYTVSITDKEIENLGLRENWDQLPATFSSMVNIFIEGEDTKLLIRSAGGQSAANLLGRFGYMHSSIYDHLTNITETESLIHNDKVLAEIVHLPQSRTGNILFRPVLRNYEIPYLAQSSVDDSRQLPLDDLTLAYRNGRILLKSKKLNKEIIPKLSNAHNFSANSLPIYHFLCDLQTQNIRKGMGFNWGMLSNKLGFLPRVEYDNIILSRATWNLKYTDIECFNKIYSDDGLISRMEEFRDRWNMPSRVALVENDNELFVDLSSPVFIRMLLDTLKKRKTFQLVEFIHSSKNAIVGDENGNKYMNQFVFDFYKDEQ
jgi:hypothetical protein